MFTKLSEKNGDYSDIAKETLGFVYLGNSPVKDESKAFYWMKKAAEESSFIGQNARAKIALADMYAKGIGVEANQALANYWKEKADKEQAEIAKSLSINTTDH